MKIKKEGSTITVYPEGRLTTENAPELRRELSDILEQAPDCDIIVDAERLEYISSSGLRALLSAAKKVRSRLRVINVSPEVYEVLEVTGFVDLMDVEKRLREIDVTGCEIIGKGAVGTVYRLDAETIVKVFDPAVSIDMIRGEQRLAKKAFVKGIPTAIPFDVVRVGDQYGSVFELLDATTLHDQFASDPGKQEETLKKFVSLMRQVHQVEADPDDLPDNRNIYLKYLEETREYLDKDLYERLRTLFSEMPEDLHMIHGDLQMKNVMLEGESPLLIDMETLSTGNPVFDLAASKVAYVTYNEDEPGNSLNFLGLSKETCDHIWERILALYFEGRSEEEIREAERRISVVAYVHFLYWQTVLKRGLADLVPIRVRHCAEHLRELTEGIEGLTV